MKPSPRPSLLQQSLAPTSVDLPDTTRFDPDTQQAAAPSLYSETRLKMLVIDAICGVGFPTPMLGSVCEQAGMARFDMESGVYEWRRNALAASTIEKLQELYDALCEARNDEFMSVGVKHGA